MSERDWMSDVFTDEDRLRFATDRAAAKINRGQRRDLASLVSRKPVWPPQNGDIKVLVENRGQRPVVHVYGKTVYRIDVAQCGVSPASTLWAARQLVSDGFVGCKHCWGRQ